MLFTKRTEGKLHNSSYSAHVARLLILCFVMSLFLTSCGEKKKELGTLTEQEAPKVEKEVEKDINGRKYKILQDGFAGLSIPYPSKWKKYVYGANSFTVFGDGCMLIVESSPVELEDGYDMKGYKPSIGDVVDYLDAQINNEQIYVDGTEYKRDIDQEASKPKDMKESKDMIVYDYDNLCLVDGSDYVDGIASERRYYYYKNKQVVSFSMIAPIDQTEYARDRIDDIMQNISAYKEPTKMIHPGAFESTLEVPAALYEVISVPDGVIYKCPETALSKYAGCFVYIQNIDKKQKVLKEDDLLFTVFSNQGVMENQYSPPVETEGEMSQIIKPSFPWTSSSLYDCMLYRKDLEGTSILLHLGTMFFETYKNDKQCVTIGYPSWVDLKDLWGVK